MIIGFNKLRTFYFFNLFLISTIILSPAASANKSIGSCNAVIFSDSTKMVRLFGKSVHNKVLPASTAKVMTALIVLEKMNLNKYVTVTSRATKAQPSKIYAKPGEKYKIKDLLYAILLGSANDASIVLAEAVAGSEQKFVKMMNARAKKLNANHTKFANSNGLPTAKGTQYTTAYDMYLIFRQALKHQFFRDAIKIKYKTIYSQDGRKISLKSHNKMLFLGWKQNIYGKTGYTRRAQGCFIGTVKKGNSDLIIGVFGCTNRWNYIKYILRKYANLQL